MQFVKSERMNVSELMKFNKNPYNRELNSKNVKNLKELILDMGEVIEPIVVNVLTGHEIDGHHRTEALFQLSSEGKLPKDFKVNVVKYKIPEEEEIDIIRSLQKGRPWTGYETHLSEIKRGNPYVIEAENFALSHTLCNDGKGKSKIRYSLALILRKDDNKLAKECSYTFTPQDVQLAHVVHNEVEEILNIIGWRQNHWLGGMICEWYKFRDLHPFNEWKKMIKRTRRKLEREPHSRRTDWHRIFSLVNSNIEFNK